MRRFLLVAAALLSSAPSSALSKDEVRGLEGLSAFRSLCGVTAAGFFGDTATITGTTLNSGGGVLYRKGQSPWALLPIHLRGPHSIVQLPDGRWLIGDTDNHRLVQIDDLSGKGEISRSELLGIKLNRPHDEIVDPGTGDVYVIDGGRHLFRFKSLEGPIEVWSFGPDEMNYVRALSWIDGKLHLIHSSRGEVMRIDDFDKREYTRFGSPRSHAAVTPENPHRDFPAGALSLTGLVLNDVEKFDGWYYGTNFFTPSYAKGADTGPARLIRWRSWDDFSSGVWEDLSDRLPSADVPVVPYFLTAHDSGLYVAYFQPSEPCAPGGVVRLEKAR